MAEAKDNSDTGEEFLKCPICLEFYVDPKRLPCLHTFCRSCLQTFITSSMKGESSESKTKVDFDCPVCRTMITIPYSEEIKTEDLASQFPTHQTICSLLDKHNIETNVKYCDPCMTEKSENPAKTWCKDHDKACCVTCITTGHRNCDNVTTLDVAAKGVKETKEIHTLIKLLYDSENALSDILRIRKQNVTKLEIQKETILSDLKAFRQRIDEHLNNLEDKLKEEITSKQKELLIEENVYISDLESKYATIVNYRKLLETSLEKASDVHTLLEMKRLINKAKVFGKELKLCTLDTNEINLELGFGQGSQIMLFSSHLGTVEV
ncbi:hypothetical protein KUTeg_008547 [Tegillarca granosa]|uniref:RING-type domain-containing protein n=1 Tax=Tegillarca granosa TaxID=220873 RepID=A0ABQ9F9G2_TEGGR|nr:hypothetical protein KUTeg_008547 [Tegillarca granosa]